MIVQEPVQAAIWHCLNHYSFMDAIFLAERLYAEVKSDDALFLLATSYYRAGKPGRAYFLLNTKGCRTSQCKFLMARCCVDLNKLGEAETSITGGSIMKSKLHEDISNEFGDSACFAAQLLGKICSQTERHNKAIEAYKRSLKLNPFLWSSYESLCNLGEKLDPSKVFQVSTIDNFNMCQGTNALIQLVNQSHNNLMENIGNETRDTVSNSTPVYSNVANSGGHPLTVIHNLADTVSETSQDGASFFVCPSLNSSSGISNKVSRLRFSRNLFNNNNSTTTQTPFTPSFGILPLDIISPMEIAPNCYMLITTSSTPYIDAQAVDAKTPIRKPITRRSQTINSPKTTVFSQSGNTSNTNNMNANIPTSPTSQSGLQTVNTTNVRRSTRLFSSSNSVKENNKSSSKVRFTSSKVPQRKPKTRTTKSTIGPAFSDNNEFTKPETGCSEGKLSSVSVSQQAVAMQKAAADGLMKLLQEMGQGYLHLAQYNCRKAIDVFTSLPPRHYNTGWVLSNLGRAYFELGEYHQASLMFAEARQLEPHHLEGAEYYSTALWHLQREVSLSALAQELTEYDKDSPEAWCASGNCFSLQKEHDTAIKFFQRAVQVHPKFPYAYTLLGHEYAQTEEMEKAMSCFRNAIRLDARHYNAWYGIGMIYYKQEKFQLAEVHYKKALTINPQSSVLMCHIAVVQHSLQKTDSALNTLNRAIASGPKNPLCKFQRASIYFTTDRHQEALKELEELKEIVPEESLVYFLVGKVHKKLGNTHLALMNFSWATDLDPKGANNQIKEAIDKRYANDDDGILATTDSALDEGNCGEAEVLDQESSHNSSILDTEEVQLQAMDSDESL